MNLETFKNELEFYNPYDPTHQALVQKLGAFCYKYNNQRITAQDVGQAIINPNGFNPITGDELNLIQQFLDCDNPKKEIFLNDINTASECYQTDRATPIVHQKGTNDRLKEACVRNSQIFDA